MLRARPDRALPWATYALVSALVLGFVAELLWGLRPWSRRWEPTLETLLAFGGLARPLVEQGDWYRLLCAAFLHADAMHLALNLVVLGIGGALLEPLLGRLWLLAVFVLGALAGSLLSLAWNEPNVVSVGASGGILALLTACLVSSSALPAGAERARLQRWVLQLLLPSLLSMLWRQSGDPIDLASHFGGAVAGVACGCFLLLTRRADEPLPRFRGAALAIVLAGSVLLAWGLSSASSARARALQRDAYASSG